MSRFAKLMLIVAVLAPGSSLPASAYHDGTCGGAAPTTVTRYCGSYTHLTGVNHSVHWQVWPSPYTGTIESFISWFDVAGVRQWWIFSCEIYQGVRQSCANSIAATGIMPPPGVTFTQVCSSYTWYIPRTDFVLSSGRNGQQGGSGNWGCGIDINFSI